MTERRYSSTAGAYTLNTSVSDSVTSLSLSATSGLPSQYPFTLVLDPGTVSEEIVTCTNLSGSTATVVRGEDGSSAQAHQGGAVIRHMASARDFREPQQHIEASIAHGVASALVGVDDAQTVTNKTLDGSNVVAQTAVTGLVSALGATVNTSGTQTVAGAKTFSDTVTFTEPVVAPNIGVTAMYRVQKGTGWGASSVTSLTLLSLPSLGTGVAYDVEVIFNFYNLPNSSATVTFTGSHVAASGDYAGFSNPSYYLDTGGSGKGSLSFYTTYPLTGANNLVLSWASTAVPNLQMDLTARVYRIA